MIIVASLLLGVAASVMLLARKSPRSWVAMACHGRLPARRREVKQRVTRPLENCFG
jgi:hypothetical protein